MYDNKVSIEFLSKSQNEAFARVAVAAFVSQLDPTIEEITDVKTAVSEAVTNSIIHGYENREDGKVRIDASIIENEIEIIISDFGRGIKKWKICSSNNGRRARNEIRTYRTKRYI